MLQAVKSHNCLTYPQAKRWRCIQSTVDNCKPAFGITVLEHYGLYNSKHVLTAADSGIVHCVLKFVNA